VAPLALMRTLRNAGLLVFLTALAGCATTRIDEYRNSEGQVRLCQPNVETLTMGFLVSNEAVANELKRLRECKEDAEVLGFVRTPLGQETEETKQKIREIDAARAASIRKR
jgi:hypothetical protein